ncbi:DUF397 domain-containing protein (plasmid) [Streptomycetaceae bacterium NBC_01309]
MNTSTALPGPHADLLGPTAEPAWRTSSYSAGEGQCVEVADLADGAAVRDSKRPGSAHLRYRARCWTAFQEAITGR